jgi:hypothetical protein
MKNLSLLPFLLLCLASFSQSITRGPDVGEIYFVGPTSTAHGLYYSTDFGETAVCVDNTFPGGGISADKTKGSIYCVINLSNLYFSNDFGQTGTWSFRQSNTYPLISSGRSPCEIFSNVSKHSNNCGNTFINHSYIGYFGQGIYTEIGVEPNVGFALVASLYIADTVFLLRTDDNYNHLSTIKRFNYLCSSDIHLTRGTQPGELYLQNFSSRELFLSFNDGLNFTLINKINHYGVTTDITGGRQDGELYVFFLLINMLWENTHTYILHSTDYGQTFEVFHPFAKGNQPLLANFSAKAIKSTPLPAGTKLVPDPRTGPRPLTVHFYNYSIGNILLNSWDFNNDGITDSYLENPKWTYSDTGYYSVKLTVRAGGDSTNSFLRENYIHVLANSPGNDTVDQAKSQAVIIDTHPNPFKDATCFEVTCDETIPEGMSIAIYDMQGRLIKTLPVKNQILWDGTDNNQERLSPGVYVYRVPGPYPTSGKVVLLR